LSTLPDIASITKDIAQRLNNIKVTATCNVCRETSDAVILEAPQIGLLIIGHKETPLDFAKAFYEEWFKSGHPEHPMVVRAEYTPEAAHAPRMITYTPELPN